MASDYARYQMHVDHHTFMLTPFGSSPRARRDAMHPLAHLDTEGTTLFIRTGCAMGAVWVSLRRLTDAAPGLAETFDPDLWEIGQEVTFTITSDLTLMDPMANDPVIEGAFSPVRPGMHRARVLARGRNTNYDRVAVTPTERYDITIWPVDTDTAPTFIGDDGIFRPRPVQQPDTATAPTTADQQRPAISPSPRERP